MKLTLRLALLFAFLTTLASAGAADLSGTWKGSFDFQGTSVPMTFHLTATGATLTGTVARMSEDPAEIHEGKIDGVTVTFWMNTAYEGQTYKLVYKGKVTPGQIDFTFGTDDGAWGSEIIAKRIEDVPAIPPAPDLTGTWKGAFDFQGTSVPLTLHLALSAGILTGNIEGLPLTPTEIHDGKIDGQTVTFWVNTTYEGSTYKLLYKGKLTPGKIDFSFGTEDQSWGTTMTATKAI